MSAVSIQRTDIVFRWKPEAAPVLDIPELTIVAGERLLIQGPRGSGKKAEHVYHRLSRLHGEAIRKERRAKELEHERRRAQ